MNLTFISPSCPFVPMHHACYYHFCGLACEGCVSIPKGGVTLAKGSVVQIKWSAGLALS